ncbi:unnamed protein product [Calypogeia fissa]
MGRRPKIRKTKTAEPPHAKEGTRSPKYVMAIDFGTTFSGAAFAKLSDINSNGKHGDDGIQLHENWPGQAEAGAKAYSKTQTSVWYMPGSIPGTFDLKGWGWTGYLGYIESAQSAGLIMKEIRQPLNSDFQVVQTKGSSRVSTRCIKNLFQRCGYFLKNFKLGVAGVEQNLPDGLKLERVISDYLRELSTYILKVTQAKDGSYATQQEVQYVFTVPAMWSPSMRKTMKDCVEMAGMVPGPLCRADSEPSPYDLIIVTEPEAAAVQVHQSLQTGSFQNSDRFLVIDVGGGTTDIIVHEKVGSTTRRNFRVKEVSASSGALVGGIHVDEKFLSYLRGKIGCFASFQTKNPRQVCEINRWWNDIKCSFTGDVKTFLLPIPGKLGKLWKRFDQENNLVAKPDYHSLSIDSEDVRTVFDFAVVNR